MAAPEQDEAPELSAVVLGYRAGRSLLEVAEPLYALLRASDVSAELVLVANYWPGRQDETPVVAEEFARGREGVRVVARPKEGAMGWDMRSGFEAARGRTMVVIDGDAQNPVDDVLRAYHTLRDTGADLVKGRRVLRHDGPYRRLVSIVYNLAFRLLFRTHGLWDINGKPKGLTREAYEQLELRSDDWFVDAEIVLKARRRGLRIVELPVTFFKNEERASLVKPSAVLEFARNMLRTRLRG
jgi:glycosyltransferase involved in cell wall biosynthesis